MVFRRSYNEDTGELLEETLDPQHTPKWKLYKRIPGGPCHLRTELWWEDNELYCRPSEPAGEPAPPLSLPSELEQAGEAAPAAAEPSQPSTPLEPPTGALSAAQAEEDDVDQDLAEYALDPDLDDGGTSDQDMVEFDAEDDLIPVETSGDVPRDQVKIVYMARTLPSKHASGVLRGTKDMKIRLNSRLRSDKIAFGQRFGVH